MITYQQEKSERLGDILVIYRDGQAIGNLSFIGKRHSDCILRAWGVEPVAFPMVSIRDITQTDIENIVKNHLERSGK